MIKELIPANLAKRALHLACSQIVGGKLTIVDGSEIASFGTMKSDSFGRDPIEATIFVNDRSAYTEILTHGSVGMGKTYAHGKWDTPDLTAVLRLLSRPFSDQNHFIEQVRNVVGPVSEVVARIRRPDKHIDRDNIGAHYDLGNDLFAKLLDETMMYSSAVFPSTESTLKEGSEEKLRRLCDLLQLKATDHVLEIGSGWGGFAVYAVKNFGCKVTTTTISQQQFDYVKNLVRDQGLDGQITILYDHYVDLSGKYDKIVSIEMIEAVQWFDYEKFFVKCRQLLKPEGQMVMQAITISAARFDYSKRRKDFIKTLIFPGGCLPSVPALAGAASKSGFMELGELQDIGLHYAETVRRWRTNLDSHADDLKQLGYDEYFQRLWRFYLTYCEAGFEERSISAGQMCFIPRNTGNPVGTASRNDEITIEI